MTCLRLNLPAIGASLAAIAAEAPVAGREGAPDKAVDIARRLLEGYRAIDTLLAEGTEIFQRGCSRQFLELNTIVLCGRTAERRLQYSDHIAATEDWFYGQGGGEALATWIESHRGRATPGFAAGLFVHAVSRPQPFIEGNRRTATLLASYALARAGLPPLVITPATCSRYRALTDPMTRIDRGGSLFGRLALAQSRSRLAAFLTDIASPEYLAAPQPAAETLSAGGARIG